MTGPEALQAMREGKCIRHAHWDEDCSMAAEYNKEWDLWELIGYGNPIFVDYIQFERHGLICDFLQDGWEVVE